VDVRVVYFYTHTFVQKKKRICLGLRFFVGSVRHRAKNETNCIILALLKESIDVSENKRDCGSFKRYNKHLETVNPYIRSSYYFRKRF